MAKRTVVTEEYTDDLDGGTAEGTVGFAYDGSQYEIDLSKANRRAFEKVLKPYVEAARRVRGSRSRGSRRGSGTGSKRDLGEVRNWARSQGIEVSDRGRVSADVLAQYDAAH